MFVLETKGQGTAEEEVKHQYMKEWIMAVNAHGGFAFGGSATPWRDS